MTTTTTLTADTAAEWFRSLPQRTSWYVRGRVVDQYMREIEWPEGEGFGSSDFWAALRWVAPEFTAKDLAEFAAMADIEQRLIAEGFDFEAGARLFA